MIEIASLPNPFDFANPIQPSQRTLLAGRDEQLRDLEYYLTQLRSDRPAINFALLGERATGKTSLLNAAQEIAENAGHIVARIDLTEADVVSPIAFWFKLFDGALHAIVRQGLLGGEHGPYYSCYLNTVAGHEDPEGARFRIFRSPGVFAHLTHDHAGWQPVHEGLIRRDLELLIGEASAGVVLLFDECDVLALNPSLLQQFRNVFMQLPGCLIGLAATPGLFPALSDTYSPIIRQFKSIAVGPFVEHEQVRSSIRERLKLLTVDLDMEDEEGRIDEVAGWDGPHSYEEHRYVQEVLDATGGYPHQVQLISHLSFRRFQRGEADLMEISLEILDEMIREIGLTEPAESRSIPRTLMELNEKQRHELDLMSRCSGKATIEQLAVAAKIVDPAGDWDLEHSRQRAEHFAEIGMLTIGEDETVEFVGDSLDRAYCRLFARRRRERLDVRSLSFDVHMSNVIADRLRGEIRPFVPLSIAPRAIAGNTLEDLRSTMETALVVGWSGVSPDATQRREIARLTRFGTVSETDETMVIFVEAVTRWSDISLIIQAKIRSPGRGPKIVESDLGKDYGRILNLVQADIESATGRAAAVSSLLVPSISEETWNGWIRASGTNEEREAVTQRQMGKVVGLHFDGESKAALEVIEESLALHRNSLVLNNAGYMSLVAGDTAKAIDYLAEAVKKDARAPLVRYNYALALALNGDIDSARHQVEAMIPMREVSVITMLLPAEGDGVVSFQEDRSAPPGPVAAASLLTAVIDAVSDRAGANPSPVDAAEEVTAPVAPENRSG